MIVWSSMATPKSICSLKQKDHEGMISFHLNMTSLKDK